MQKPDKQKLINAINRFSELSILVIGDVMLDVYDFCYTKNSKELISEKKGKRAYLTQDSIQTLGAAGNVALNLSSLKARTYIISVCGDDPHYHTLRKSAEEHNIHHFFIRDPKRITTVKTRIYIDDEFMMRKDHEITGKITFDISLSVLDQFYYLIKKMNAVILSDYDKGIFTEHITEKIIDECDRLKIPVIVDFKPQNKDLFSGSTLMTPNYYEAKAVYPEFEADNNQNESIKKVASLLNASQLIITLHENGSCGFDGTESFHIPANKVTEKDAVGCGDTSISLLALSLASGLSLFEAANLANDGAGIVVTKPATSNISPEELIEFISKKY